MVAIRDDEPRSLEQAARELPLSRDTLRKMMDEGLIRTVRPYRRRLIPPSEMERLKTQLQ